MIARLFLAGCFAHLTVQLGDCLQSIPDVLEYFNASDASQITWAIEVNSWRELERRLQDDSMMLCGKVWLDDKTMKPVLAYPPQISERISLHRWLKTVGNYRKGIRLEIGKTAAVQPALSRLFASLHHLNQPLWIHANILNGPNGYLEPFPTVDSKAFIKLTSKLLPMAIISVGWSSSYVDQSLAENRSNRLTWQHIFEMLDAVYDVRQDVNFDIRAVFLRQSLIPILFLSSISDRFSLSVYREVTDPADPDWLALASLRQNTNQSRTFYRFADWAIPSITDFYAQSGGLRRPLSNVDRHRWKEREHWEPFQFLSPDKFLSAVIPSDFGVALLGWPTGFLLSQRTFYGGRRQRVTGRLLFVCKRGARAPADEDFSTGVSVFLLPYLESIPGPRLQGGIEARIERTGRVSLLDRSRTDSVVDTSYYLPNVVGQLVPFDCYDFELVDFGDQVRLDVKVSGACVGRIDQPLPIHSARRTLDMRVRPARRRAAVQKTGDVQTDVLLQHLEHSSASTISTWTSLVFSLHLVLR